MKLTRKHNETKYVLKEFQQLRLGECFIKVNDCIEGDYIESDYNVYIKIGVSRDDYNAYSLTRNYHNIINQNTNVYVLDANLRWDFAKINTMEE